MPKKFAKFISAISAVLLLSFSTNSFAGGYYGKIGYSHYPIKVVIGHHGHYGHKSRYYNHRSRPYYGHRGRYYNKHYNYRHRSHYYPQRRYCPSRY